MRLEPLNDMRDGDPGASFRHLGAVQHDRGLTHMHLVEPWANQISKVNAQNRMLQPQPAACTGASVIG